MKRRVTFDEYVHILSKIKLTKLKNLNSGELLCSTYFNINGDEITNLSAIKVSLAAFFLRKSKFEQHGEGKILYIFSNSYEHRKDYLSDLYTVANLNKNFTVCTSSKKFNFSLRNLKFLGLYIKWVHDLKVDILTYAERCYLAALLLVGYMMDVDVQKWCKKHPVSLVTSLCDIHLTDYLLINHFNLQQIPTATLQHASFSSLGGGYAYKYSHSKYFLATNQYSKDEALKAGYPKEGQIMICGPMKYIKNSSSLPITFNHKVIGIALGGSTEMGKKENKLLIELGNEILQKMNCNIFYRLHPGNKAIRNDINHDQRTQICSSELSMRDYANHCDLIITGSSNVFVDLVCINYPVLRMTKETDLYPNIADLKFDTVDKGIDMIMEYYRKPKSEIGEILRSARSYFMPDNIQDLYRSFFKNFDT